MKPSFFIRVDRRVIGVGELKSEVRSIGRPWGRRRRGMGDDSSESKKHRNLVFAKKHFSRFSDVENTNLKSVSGKCSLGWYLYKTGVVLLETDLFVRND